jgi:hypothetical protein
MQMDAFHEGIQRIIKQAIAHTLNLSDTEQRPHVDSASQGGGNGSVDGCSDGVLDKWRDAAGKWSGVMEPWHVFIMRRARVKSQPQAILLTLRLSQGGSFGSSVADPSAAHLVQRLRECCNSGLLEVSCVVCKWGIACIT